MFDVEYKVFLTLGIRIESICTRRNTEFVLEIKRERR